MITNEQMYSEATRLIEKYYDKIDKVCDYRDKDYNAEAREWWQEIEKLYAEIGAYEAKLERKYGLYWYEEEFDE